MLIKSKFTISIIYKFLGVLFNLITTYTLLKYYNQSEYGILVTINSIVGLMLFFDFGINHGVKNLITFSFSSFDYLNTRKIISSSYFMLCSISLLLLIAFILAVNILSQYQNYDFIKNFNYVIKNKILYYLLLITIPFYFISNFIHVILLAINKFVYSNCINFLTQFVIFFYTFVILNLWKLNYFLMAIPLIVIPIIINFISTLIFFKLNKNIRPSCLNFELTSVKLILNKSFHFIFIQIGTIILFQTNSVLILIFLGSKYVTEYDVVYKFFSIVLLTFNIYITPYWSKIAIINSTKDSTSLLCLIKILKKRIIYFISSAILLIPCCKYFINIWIGSSVIIHLEVIIAISIYIISYIVQSAYSHVLNGIGVIKTQAILLIISGVLNIPLIYFLSKFIGLSGVIYANSFFLFFLGWYYKRQINKLIF
jgi:O-antigen/teichoic acid export membrane protein